MRPGLRPPKGADEALIAQLDRNTEQLTRKVETWQNCSLAAQPGLGAAGLRFDVKRSVPL